MYFIPFLICYLVAIHLFISYIIRFIYMFVFTLEFFNHINFYKIKIQTSLCVFEIYSIHSPSWWRYKHSTKFILRHQSYAFNAHSRALPDFFFLSSKKHHKNFLWCRCSVSRKFHCHHDGSCTSGIVSTIPL